MNPSPKPSAIVAIGRSLSESSTGSTSLSATRTTVARRSFRMPDAAFRRSARRRLIRFLALSSAGDWSSRGALSKSATSADNASRSCCRVCKFLVLLLAMTFPSAMLVPGLALEQLLVVAEFVDQPTPLLDADAVVRGEMLGLVVDGGDRVAIFFVLSSAIMVLLLPSTSFTDFSSTTRFMTNQNPFAVRWF